MRLQIHVTSASQDAIPVRTPLTARNANTAYISKSEWNNLARSTITMALITLSGQHITALSAPITATVDIMETELLGLVKIALLGANIVQQSFTEIGQPANPVQVGVL